MKSSNSFSSVLEKAGSLCTSAGLGRYLEPFEHALEVERLRQMNRPVCGVKLLVLAESHVRVSAESFARNGPGFIYEPRYYSPWWPRLLLPAFGTVQPTSPNTRLHWLSRLRSSGVWLLDVSLLSLSGYRKVDRAWPARPLDNIRRQLIWDSWSGYVQPLFERVMNQRSRPVVCAFNSIAFVLPAEIRKEAAILNFLGKSNSKVYFDAAYPSGTARFREAVRTAGIDGCLLP